MGAVVKPVNQSPLFGTHEQERTLDLQERMLNLRLERIRASRQIFVDERKALIDMLLMFLIETLAILTLAIIGLAFVDTLYAWVRTMRTFILLASVGLGIGPAVMVWKAIRQSRPRPAPTIALLALLVLVSSALAGPVRCTTYEEKTPGRLQTLCDDGTRAVSTWSSTLQQWQTTITASPRQECRGLLTPRTHQVEGHCR